MPEIIGEVTGINYYPIKSCQVATVDGQVPDALAIGLTGFEAYGVPDRGYVIKDQAEGVFVSRRGWDSSRSLKHPRDQLELAQVAVDVRQGLMTVSHPEAGTLRIPTHTGLHEQGRVAVFESSFHGYDVGEEAAEYFSGVLHRSVEVVGYDPAARPREIEKSKYRFPETVNVTAGSDGFPFSLINQASLDQLHDEAGIKLGTLPIGAFRMNLETVLVEPWIEDRLRRVRIGGLSAVVAKACSRCPIPNQDIETGEHTGLSNRLLRPTRSGWKADADRTDKAEMFMGENLNHDSSSIGQIVRVGDLVEAVSFGEPNFISKS